VGLGWVRTGQTSSEENPKLQQAVIPQDAAREHHPPRLSEFLGATHTPSSTLAVTLPGACSRSLTPSEQFFKAPLSVTSFQQRPGDQFAARETSSCPGPPPPALPQALPLLPNMGARTQGAQHCKAGIPTGTEVKNRSIPCGSPSGNLCAKGYALLVC